MFKGVADGEILIALACLGSKVVSYTKNQTIFISGDEDAHMGVVLSGCVNVVRMDADGAVELIDKLGAGSVFGAAFLFSGVTTNVEIYASVPSEVLFLKTEKIARSCSSECSLHAQMMKNLLFTMSDMLKDMGSRLCIMHKSTIRKKLMEYFEFSASDTGGDTFTIPFSRYELADYIGVNRCAMSRELHKMEEDGLIECSGKVFTLCKNKQERSSY